MKRFELTVAGIILIVGMIIGSGYYQDSQNTPPAGSTSTNTANIQPAATESTSTSLKMPLIVDSPSVESTVGQSQECIQEITLIQEVSSDETGVQLLQSELSQNMFITSEKIQVQTEIVTLQQNIVTLKKQLASLQKNYNNCP